MSIAGHRWHAALVHFPVVCWTFAALIELIPAAASWLDGQGVSALTVTVLLVWLGVVLAIPAAIAGGVEVSRLSAATEATAIAARHVLLVMGAFFAFVLMGLLLSYPSVFELPAGASRVAAAVGLLLLLGAGHAGGKVVVARHNG